MRSVLISLIIVTMLAGLAGFAWGGLEAALAALFGAAIALVNAGLIAWRLQRSKRQLHADPHRHLRSFYFYTIERYLTVGVLFAMGIGVLKLMPGVQLAAFIVAQLAFIFASGLRSGTD